MDSAALKRQMVLILKAELQLVGFDIELGDADDDYIIQFLLPIWAEKSKEIAEKKNGGGEFYY